MQITFRNVNEVMKGEMEAYILTKLQSLAQFLPDGASDTVLATVVVEHFEKHDAYRVDIRLLVKHGKEQLFTAEETKHSYTESADAVKDKLQMQILKAKEKMQHQGA